MPERELLDTAELAKYLNRSESVIRYWRENGKGPPYYRVVGQYMYQRDEVDAWLQTNRVDPTEG
jgi:DNA-binding transcriptional MerR regulator